MIKNNGDQKSNDTKKCLETSTIDTADGREPIFVALPDLHLCNSGSASRPAKVQLWNRDKNWPSTIGSVEGRGVQLAETRNRRARQKRG